MKKESILRGVFNYSISSWINIIVGFLSVAITTRIIEPDSYGIISIFLSAANFAMYILTFGMDGAYIRFYNAPPADNTRSQMLYKVTFFTSVISIILSIIVIGPLYRYSSGHIFGIESRLLVLMLVLYTYSQAIFRYLNITYRMGFRTKEYTIQNVLINCFTRLLIIGVGLLTNNVNVIILAMGLGLFGLMLIYVFIQRHEIIPVNRDGHKDYSIIMKGYGDFFRFSIYSAPSYFVTYFNGFMSQIIIKTISNSYALGIFASCAMFKTIFAALQGGFSTYWSAYVYKNYDTDKKRIVDMHDYILLFALFCVAGLLIGRDLIYLIIGEEYQESKSFFSLLLIASVLSLIRETTDKGLALAKKNEITLMANIVSVAINLVGCYLLTSQFGIKGAAYADAISAIVLYVIITCYGQKYYKTINQVTKSVFMILLIIVLMIVPSINENLLFIAIGSLGIIVIAVIVMRKEIRNMIRLMAIFVKDTLNP